MPEVSLPEVSFLTWVVVMLGAISVITGFVSQTHPLTRQGKDITAILAFTCAGTAVIISPFT